MEEKYTGDEGKETQEKINLAVKIENENEQKDASLNSQTKENENMPNQIIEEDKLVAEDFKFFQDDMEMSKEFENLGKELEKINNIKENDLEDYVKECIEDLEEFSSILNLEDLIVDPTYTFHLLMKCLKKVINFKCFYTKLTIPKNKNKEESIKNNKNDKNEHLIKKIVKKQITNKKLNKNNGIENEGECENDGISRKNGNEKKEKDCEIDESKENNNSIKNKNEKEKTNCELKNKPKNNENENKIINIENLQNNMNNENEKKNSENLINNNENENEKALYKNDESHQNQKENIKKEINLENTRNINNINNGDQKTQNEKKIKKYKFEQFENHKTHFILRLSEKANELKEGNQISLKKENPNAKAPETHESNNTNILSKGSTSEIPQSLSNIMFKSSNEKSSDNNQKITNNSVSKIEEYKQMNYDNILPIIRNNAIVEEDNFVEGKGFESKVRKYFNIVLSICTEQSLSVYSNPGKSIQSFYIYYEDLIKKNEYKKIKNISGSSQRKNDNKLEIDLMIDNVSSKIIKKMVKIFNTSIIAKKFDEKEDDRKNYQIIGEVAKNLLNQSIDKLKQVGKIIDILLIDKNITINDFVNSDPKLQNFLISEYMNLNLDIKQNKMIFLCTDGSFLELKKAVLFNENEILNNDYESVDIKSIFPIMNKYRYARNILSFKKIIENLNNSNIPYIIFYVGEELNNGIERILINHIKKCPNKAEYKKIISKIEENEKLISKNISQSFIIKTINKNLKKLNKNEIFDVIQNISSSIPKNDIKNYLKFLFENIVEIKNNNEKYFILIFFISNDEINYSTFKKYINDFNTNNRFTSVELMKINEENDLLKEYSKYQNKKIIKVFIIKDDIQDIQLNYDVIIKDNIDFEIKNPSENMNINFLGVYYYKIKNIIKNYILSNFTHFYKEGYLDSKLLYKKLVYDLKYFEEELPIKIKVINEDVRKQFVENLRDMINKIFSTDLIMNKSIDILYKIKQCIGKELYICLISKRENEIKAIIEKNLKKITEHIICYSIYEKFFYENLLSGVQE